MITKIKALINWALESKVGNGFAFILYMVLCAALALLLRGTFVEVAAALFAGLGVQTGQRTYTKVSLTRKEIDAGLKTNCGEPAQGKSGDPLS